MVDVDLKALFQRHNRYIRSRLEAAAGQSMSRGHYEVAVEHVLAVMLEDREHDLGLLLREAGVEAARLQASLERALRGLKTGNTGRPVFAPRLLEWLEQAWLLASVDYGLAEVRSGVLVLALLRQPQRFAVDWLGETEELDAARLRAGLLDRLAASREATVALEGRLETTPSPAADDPEGALARFCEDLTAKASAGRIDPVFGREHEIRQIINILGRRRKNNPICVGEAGVGKSAVVEGLALKIVEGDVPDFLQDVRVLNLDLQLFQAGASVKGEFENRLKGVVEEAKGASRPVILFIDEVHTLIGAGGQAGTGDAANLLKPALARGELRTIAATTFSEYKRYIDKDAALARRFQPVSLDEPSPEQAVTILRGLRDIYERAHGVYIRDDALVAAAQLSARYVAGRQLPDKAIDTLDTAAARVRLSVATKPWALDDLERQVATLAREHGARRRDATNGAADDQAELAAIEARIAELEEQRVAFAARWERERGCVEALLEVRRQLADADDETAVRLRADRTRRLAELADAQSEGALIHYEVSPDIVAQVIADWTGVPKSNMRPAQGDGVVDLAVELRQRIRGQDHVVDALDRAMRLARVGLQNPDAPLGVFLFVGPSGVGKTETAIGLADLLFGGERFMTTINMSEFQDKHTISRLIGSAPGLVGYGEGGQLTEAVRQRPYSVVLLDEVEKADLEVMNLFYHVFDKGVLSDGEGRVINFRNTVVIMTSNLASDVVTEMGGDGAIPVETLLDAIRPVLSDHFTPALLARMHVVPFLPIRAEAMQDIVRLKLDRIGRRVEQAHKFRFSYGDEVVQAIVARCTEVETGARNIDHIVQQTLLPQIASSLLNTLVEPTPQSEIALGVDGDGAFEVRVA